MTTLFEYAIFGVEQEGDRTWLQVTDITTTEEAGVIVNRAGSSVRLDDIADYIKQNIEDWADKDVIWDLTDFDSSYTTSDEVRGFVARMYSFGGARKGRKTAIIAPSDSGFGLMRMLESNAELWSYPVQFNVFRSREPADKWLAKDD